MSKKKIILLVIGSFVIVSLVVVSCLYVSSPAIFYSREKLQKELNKNFYIPINDKIEITYYKLTNDSRSADLKIPVEVFDDILEDWKKQGYHIIEGRMRDGLLEVNYRQLPTETVEDIYAVYGVDDEKRIYIHAYITKPTGRYRIVYLRG